MFTIKRVQFHLLVVLLLATPATSPAEEAKQSGSDSAEMTHESAEKAPEKSEKQRARRGKPKGPKGKIAREKEAEGTQAPNRFSTDNIVKSKYELNGQPLEVDTD